MTGSEEGEEGEEGEVGVVWGGRGDSSTPSGGLESDMDEGKGRKGRRERKKVDVFLVVWTRNRKETLSSSLGMEEGRKRKRSKGYEKSFLESQY